MIALDFRLWQGSFTLDIDIRLELPVTALLGHSGAGKTTVLDAIAGLRTPGSGSIAINDRVVFDSRAGINVPTHRRHVGYVAQDVALFPHMQFYHWAYGINQWLASQGYVVMSVNYRSGIGYGRSFRTAPNTGGSGNAEYQDVLAAGKYLQTRSDVDPNRIGIWGLSYGGVLTSQALARNSDIFKAGVDLAGVHLWGSSLDPDAVSFKSSTIGAIDGWKSPVLLVHGDDDRNVAFQQTTGLVQLLRQRDVYFELIVFPDDTHESMLHSRWMYTLGRMETFFRKFLGPDNGMTTASGK